MTSTAPGAHPLPEEVDALLDPSGGDARVGAHVAICDHCGEVRDDLLKVRTLLGEQARSLPPEPPDLGERIAAALAAEPALVPSGASRDVGPTTVVSLDERRRRPWTTWLAAAAGVAVIGAGGTFLLDQVGGGADSAGSAAEAPAMAPQDAESGGLGGVSGSDTGGEESAPESTVATTADAQDMRSFSASGTDYTRPGLVAQAQALLLTADRPGPQSSPVPDDLLSDAAALDACLDAVGRPGAEPVVTDLGTFEGQEAAVVVIPDQDGYDVLVVPARCGDGDDRVLASADLR